MVKCLFCSHKIPNCKEYKKVRYIAQKTMVKKAIIKEITGFITSTIGASGISYGLDYLGVY
jgi:hypothetical protein